MSKPLFKVNASVIIKNHDCEILMIKRSDEEDVFPGFWGIPGGTVEPTDFSLEHALMRECMEEVGIRINNIKHLSNDISDKGDNKGALYIVYTAEYESGNPKPLDGTAEVAWLSVNTIRNLQLTPKTMELIELCPD